MRKLRSDSKTGTTGKTTVDCGQERPTAPRLPTTERLASSKAWQAAAVISSSARCYLATVSGSLCRTPVAFRKCPT